MKLKPVILAIAALVATTTTFAQSAPIKEPVLQAAPGVTPVVPGFLPPGLNSMRQQTTAPVAPAPKVAPSTFIAPAAQADVVGLQKPKTPAQIAEAEARKFKPTGKKVIVSEATTAQLNFEADQGFRGATLLTPILPLKLEPIINARPGEPVTVVIGVGALNRIVTPFDDAVVDTVANVQVKKAGGVIMLATASVEPFSIIVHEKETPENAVMINLVPKTDVPARDVKIIGAFAKNNAAASGSTRDSDSPEKDIAHPLAVKLKNVMRDLAKGKIPSGYALEKGNGAAAKCNLPGFETREAQVLAGATMTIRVYAATNISDGVNEIDERGCSSRKHLASAVWPRMTLSKGEKTELFLIEAPARDNAETSARPSAIQ